MQGPVLKAPWGRWGSLRRGETEPQREAGSTKPHFKPPDMGAVACLLALTLTDHKTQEREKPAPTAARKPSLKQKRRDSGFLLFFSVCFGQDLRPDLHRSWPGTGRN